MRQRYVQAAVDSEIEMLRDASSGRACATFRAAAAIGGFVGAGEVDRGDAEQVLLEAAIETGLPEREALSHIRRGIRRGELTPRCLPDDARDDRFHRSPRHRIWPDTAERNATADSMARPPKAEVDAMWAASRAVGSNPEVVAWFARRYGASASSFIVRAELWDFTRAIPDGAQLPGWASCGGRSWTRTGHRILFRLWDHSGQAISVRARCVDPATTPKSLAPSGYSVRGAVLADPLAAQILGGFCPDWWQLREIVVTEGEPDTLLWVARQREAEAQGPAVLGIEAGAWSQEIADRVPDGARVALRVHHDEPGERYAREIALTLRGRCSVFRGRAAGEASR